MTRTTIDTTYADLRPSDLVVDKSGQAWPIKDLIDGSKGVNTMRFWLCDPTTGVRMYDKVMVATDSVKVSRLPTQADEASKLEAEVSDAETLAAVAKSDDFVTLEEAVAAVEDIGGTVEAEVTAAEVDAAAAATDDSPLTLPPFDTMTPLEQRSHLYLLHGVYGSDVTGKAELSAIHGQAQAEHDAGILQSRHVPHVHA